MKPLVDQGVLRLETGGVLRDGADAWLLGQWDLSKFGDVANEVFGAEGILPYATVMANHSGRRGILLGSTSIRICCSNTLGAAQWRWASADGRKSITVRVPSLVCSRLQTKCSTGSSKNLTLSPVNIVSS